MKSKLAKRKAATPKGKSNANSSIADALLSTIVAVQMKRKSSCISFMKIMEARKMNHKNTGWRNEWRKLIEEGLIQPSSKPESGTKGNGVFTAAYELTEKGEEKAGSPDQKEIKRLMEMTVNTTEEEHARIRKLCMNNRAIEIFDLLLKHGSLTRKELAATIGISDRGAPFSYGLRDLKRRGYIIVDEKFAVRGRKLLKLADKAFLKAEDRPQPIEIDPVTMSANMEKVYGKEMKKAAAAKSRKNFVKMREAAAQSRSNSVKMENRDDNHSEEKKED